MLQWSDDIFDYAALIFAEFKFANGKEPHIVKLDRSYPQLCFGANVAGKFIKKDESNKLRTNQQKCFNFRPTFTHQNEKL